MGGFFGWFLTFILVVAIFNAEKWPSLRSMIEEKIKESVDAAKEGSKLASDKIKQVKTGLDTKRNATKTKNEAEENTPEEIAESLQFMENYIKPEEKLENTPKSVENTNIQEIEPDAETLELSEDEKPIDLEHHY